MRSEFVFPRKWQGRTILIGQSPLLQSQSYEVKWNYWRQGSLKTWKVYWVNNVFFDGVTCFKQQSDLINLCNWKTKIITT